MRKLNIAAEKDGLGLNAPLEKSTLDKVKKQMVDDMDRIIKNALKNKMSLLEWQKQGTSPLEQAMGKYMGL